MSQDRPNPFVRSGPSSGGAVNGWLVAILIILFAALYLQMSGLWPQPLFDPNAGARTVTPRGDLAEDEKSTIALFRAADQSVVHITTSVVRQRYQMDPLNIPLGSGSGIIWDQKGYIVTNYHVVRDARMNGGAIQVVLADSSSYPAQIVNVSRDADLAVLKINAPASKLKPIPIGKSSDLQVGQKVFAIGSPFSLDQTLTTGIVSGLGREIKTPSGATLKDAIQVSAPINPGNSGGALLDSAGRLIGVNAAILSGTGEFSGVGFAIPVDTVNSIVPELIRAPAAEPGALGVVPLRDDQTAMLRQAGVFKEQGVAVRYVESGSAAEAAGILPLRQDIEGQFHIDLIVAVDGKPVHSVNDLVRILASKKAGDVVKLTIVRDNKRMDVSVTLTPRPETEG
jgi:S1-C subfamily serine protease